MKRLLKASSASAFALAFVMLVSSFTVITNAAAASGKLNAPDNFTFEYAAAGAIIPDMENPGIGPEVQNANRALVWDAVPNATGYMVYAFENMDETDPNKAYRSQMVSEPQIMIGHESVTQAREKFNDTEGEQLCEDTEPVNEDGYISWGVMIASSRQDFEVPLPYKEFYFRVVALAENERNNSDMSDWTLTLPGARSVSPIQAKLLIEDAKERGAAYPYFVFIQTGTLRYMPNEAGEAGGGVAGRLYIPFANTPTPNPDYFGDNIDSQTARDFAARVAIEIQNHPAYIGEDTLVFSG